METPQSDWSTISPTTLRFSEQRAGAWPTSLLVNGFLGYMAAGPFFALHLMLPMGVFLALGVKDNDDSGPMVVKFLLGALGMVVAIVAANVAMVKVFRVVNRRRHWIVTWVVVLTPAVAVFFWPKLYRAIGWNWL